MKVRWTPESVRLRITPSELASLVHGNKIDTALSANGANGWSVSVSPGSTVTSYHFVESNLVVNLSTNDVEDLANETEVGIYFSGVSVPRSGMRLSIEKDLPCAHPRGTNELEPQTETFGAPKDFENRKLT